jgi:hypothetical protein
MTSSSIFDNIPVGIVDDRDIVFSTALKGDTVAMLSPIDTGATTGGRWAIDSQSHPGLFTLAYDPARDNNAHLVIADGAAMPDVGLGVSVTVHFYDRNQVDAFGEPVPGTGVARTLVYTVEAGATRELGGFGPDLALGAASSSANPTLATLSTGDFVAVWQDAGGALHAQLRGADGSARGSVFALTTGDDAVIEGEPAVAALDAGRFVVAYTANEGGASRIGYRIVEANGQVGAQWLADGAAGLDTAMPAVATLADGSFVVGWRSGGEVHLRHASGTTGAPLGAEQVVAALGSAYSPSIAALRGGGYALAWGEINDGNVYAAVVHGQGAHPILVSGDGYAASIATAAPLPHVAALGDGGFVVAWDSYMNSPFGFTGSDIFFQRYDASGQPVGVMAQANTDGGGGRFDASVAALPDGGFVIAWQSQQGDFDGSGIFGRRFAADGTALDAREFAINEMRQGDQASPDITALASGGFAVVWADTQPYGGATTVEARVLADIDGGAAVPALPGTGSQGTAPVPEPVVTAPAPAPALLTPPPVVKAPSPPVSSTAPVKTIMGSDALDIVAYGGSHASFTVQRDSAGFSVTAKDGARDALVNVERIKFNDAMLALDIDGTAGQAYRLYRAAFDRVPDKGGLGYWIDMMDKGVTLEQAASGFTTSREFADLYGADASDAQFVQLLYKNVLHREAEGPGFEYWMDALGEKDVPREQVLGFFSESHENQVQVIGSIQDGILFTPWGG